MKGTLKALLEGPAARDALNGQSEFVVLLVRPPGSDALAKAPRKVRKAGQSSTVYLTVVLRKVLCRFAVDSPLI